MRKENKKNFIKNIDFEKLTPKIQFKKVKMSELYKKALWENDEKERSEFGRNTRTWD